MAFLKVMSGPLQGQTLEIDRDETVIGRSPDCVLVLNDAAASSRHCAIVRDGRKFWIRDMNSTNGTLLNDSPVKESRIAPGDVVTAGSVEIMFGGTDVDIVELAPPPPTAERAVAAAEVPGRVAPTVPVSPFGAKRDNRWILITAIVVIALVSLAALAWFLVRLFA